MHTATQSTNGFGTNEATLPKAPVDVRNLKTIDDRCCFVQMHPPNIIDGMFSLDDGTYVLGRSPDCDLAIHDENVSRRHAQVVRESDVTSIVDLGSTNGTLVNGREIAGPTVLNTDDTVQLGSYLFRYLSSSGFEAKYHEAVYSALTRDGLTGTLNKRSLGEFMSREIARSRRTESPMAVVMIDIDHFKLINDTHGHLVGDEVLREFAQRLDRVCRQDDILARYGGEEFCLLLTATAEPDARRMAERCRVAVSSDPVVTKSGPIEVTASFGFALLDHENDESSESLIARADAELYRAKTSGRNRVCG